MVLKVAAANAAASRARPDPHRRRCQPLARAPAPTRPLPTTTRTDAAAAAERRHSSSSSSRGGGGDLGPGPADRDGQADRRRGRRALDAQPRLAHPAGAALGRQVGEGEGCLHGCLLAVIVCSACSPAWHNNQLGQLWGGKSMRGAASLLGVRGAPAVVLVVRRVWGCAACCSQRACLRRVGSCAGSQQQAPALHPDTSHPPTLLPCACVCFRTCQWRTPSQMTLQICWAGGSSRRATSGC